MNAFEILVIILSVALATFLLISIILVALLVKVTLQIRKVTDGAQKAVDNIESLTGGVTRAASKAMLGRIFLKGFKKVIKKK